MIPLLVLQFRIKVADFSEEVSSSIKTESARAYNLSPQRTLSLHGASEESRWLEAAQAHQAQEAQGLYLDLRLHHLLLVEPHHHQQSPGIRHGILQGLWVPNQELRRSRSRSRHWRITSSATVRHGL